MTAPRDLCIMACTFCRDRDFWHWMASLAADGPDRFDESGAKAFILNLCCVSSRSQLDTDPTAGARFLSLVRDPFVEWKRLGTDPFLEWKAAQTIPDWIPQ